MDDVITRFIDLPTTIHGYTVRDHNGDFNIFINARISYEQQLEAYRHEKQHIDNNDFSKRGRMDLIEVYAHRIARNEDFDVTMTEK